LARAPEVGSDVHRERHRAVLETAARLICAKGYEAASVQDIADACGLTKAGLYYYIRSKEDLLLEIQNYGMDIFEERVLLPVLSISDPVERLKACMERNIFLVTEGWSKEVTIILHEHDTLTGDARRHINARKKRYVHFLESSFEEAMREGRLRRVEPRVAAFSFLGQVLWIYKWYRPDGRIPAERLSREMQDLFFGGLEIPPAPAAKSVKKGRKKEPAR
jgi:AcrR family transcriptional regulator